MDEVEIIDIEGKRSTFDFINIVLPTRLNSSLWILWCSLLEQKRRSHDHGINSRDTIPGRIP